MIDIELIRLSVIGMPLKNPFSTHLGTVTNREAIIVEVVDTDGVVGYGETVAFSSPWYTEETVQTALHVQKKFLIPLLSQARIEHPSEVYSLFGAVRRNEMAKAGLETAIWDLYAKRQGIPLAKLLGGTRKEVLVGAVVATQDLDQACLQVKEYLEQGYQRIKLKIDPNHDGVFLHEIRQQFPNAPLMIDANSGYTLSHLRQLQALDAFQLQMIEQPLGNADLVDHAILQKQLTTPICLDESITSVHDAKSALKLGSCKVMNIKIGRVGGLENAKQIHDLCIVKHVPVWCGGMIEFGISRAHNLALASLQGFSIPGDIFPSTHYWEEDIIEPDIKVKDGKIAVPPKPGIGFRVKEKRLRQITIHREEFHHIHG